MDQTSSVPDKKAPRLGYLSRATTSFYRTFLARTSPSKDFDKTLQLFVLVFSSSTVCRATLKDKLRQILLKGAFATRTTTPTSTRPSSVVQRDLFEDITEPLLRELSLRFFTSFDSRSKYDYCKEILENWETGRHWCNIEVEEPWGKLLKRCHTCKTLVGARIALESLVLREPWLITEGVAGAPIKEAWEVEGEEKKEGDEDEEDATPDGWTKEEREKMRREAEEAVMRRWGLLAAEEAEKKEAK
ncbi:hypothetical protein H2200_006692 [Cladophialophora chaetospira]|uniref:Uncharacterized protein n=1 Tax=Cladophialophora chaetospira TaxID=386627 RepID=A0AA39CI61_9EURO|nr:hypothetical protein H2200_006692 [Cladophialophora chaetospira]